MEIKRELDKNICFVCGGEFKHYIRYTTPQLQAGDFPNMRECNFIMSHVGCRILERKLKEAKAHLLDLEFEMFCRQLNKQKD